MSWVAVAVAGGAVVSGAMTSSAMRKGANQQSDAANQATELSREQYNAAVQRNAPFVSGGTQAFNALMDRLGLSGRTDAVGYNSMQPRQFDPGTDFRAPTAEEVMATAGYKFGLNQGQAMLERQQRARGTSYSGAALAAAARYGNDYASGQYGNAFSRALTSQQQNFNQRLNAFNAGLSGDQQYYNQIANLAGMGQASANNTNALGSTFASTAGQNLQGAANAQAANSIAQGNIWGNVVNQGASAYSNWLRNNPSLQGQSQYPVMDTGPGPGYDYLTNYQGP